MTPNIETITIIKAFPSGLTYTVGRKYNIRNKIFKDLLKFYGNEATKDFFAAELAEEIIQDPNVLHCSTKPKEGTWYYACSWLGEIQRWTWNNDSMDNRCFALRNCYTTEAKALLSLAILSAKGELQAIATRLNKGRKINWKDSTQFKHYAHYDYVEQVVLQNYVVTHKLSNIYCLDFSFTKIALAEMGETKLILALEV